MVIDTVTSSPFVISYHCLLRRGPGNWNTSLGGVCVCAGCGGSEHYHGRLMGVNYTGVVRARLHAANVDHSTLCHVDDGGDRRGPESVSIPLWTDSISFSVIGSSRSIQQICHTQTRKGGGGQSRRNFLNANYLFPSN